MLPETMSSSHDLLECRRRAAKTLARFSFHRRPACFDQLSSSLLAIPQFPHAVTSRSPTDTGREPLPRQLGQTAQGNPRATQVRLERLYSLNVKSWSQCCVS